MIRILFNKQGEKLALNIPVQEFSDQWFKSNWKHSWLEDEFVQHIIRTLEGITSAEDIKLEDLHYETKVCLSIYKVETAIRLGPMSEKGVAMIERISRRIGFVFIVTDADLHFSKRLYAKCLNDGSTLGSYGDYYHALRKFVK